MYGGKSRKNIDSMKNFLIKSMKLVLSSHETKKDVFSSRSLRFESFCNNLVIGRRKFLVGGTLPEDEALRFCPVCKCKNCVDLPSSNEGKFLRNKEKLDKYQSERTE